MRVRAFRDKPTFLGLSYLLFVAANCHSWVEQLTVIAPNGTFVGEPGYPRGNVLRTQSGFSDTEMVYLLPPSTRANSGQFLSSDPMCKETQQQQTQTSGSPRLKAAAGDAVALRFQENGHVTLPQNQPGKPTNRGNIYVYGTTDPKPDDSFLAIHNVWNADGTGGDKRGVLLSTQTFDDGRCYQVNGGQISTQRQAEYPHEANQLMGSDLWCQQDIALPADAPSGKPYTLYWVWDWPTLPGVDPNLPNGKQETYTTCMDVDVVPSQDEKVASVAQNEAVYLQDQSLNDAAIPEQMSALAQNPNPPAVTGQGSSASTASVQTPVSPATTQQTPVPSATTQPPRVSSSPGDAIFTKLVTLLVYPESVAILGRSPATLTNDVATPLPSGGLVGRYRYQSRYNDLRASAATLDSRDMSDGEFQNDLRQSPSDGDVIAPVFNNHHWPAKREHDERRFYPFPLPTAVLGEKPANTA